MTAAFRNQSSAVVIAIDGPAGAGKSSVSRLLAKQLGFDFLDTGAMYRCVTLAALRSGVSLSDQTAVEELAKSLKIEFDEDRVHLDGQDVTQDIRTTEVATSVGMIADNLAVRRMLTQMQRDWAVGRRVVSEGRDQGTDVFPDAACKIFLVADNLERAKRRQAELAAKGICLALDSILAQQEVRDQADRSRPPRKPSAVPTAATRAVAVSGPIPGTSVRRLAAWSWPAALVSS